MSAWIWEIYIWRVCTNNGGLSPLVSRVIGVVSIRRSMLWGAKTRNGRTRLTYSWNKAHYLPQGFYRFAYYWARGSRTVARCGKNAILKCGWDEYWIESLANRLFDDFYIFLSTIVVVSQSHGVMISSICVVSSRLRLACVELSLAFLTLHFEVD